MCPNLLRFVDRLEKVFDPFGQVVEAPLGDREHPGREPGVDGHGIDQALIFGVFPCAGVFAALAMFRRKSFRSMIEEELS